MNTNLKVVAMLAACCSTLAGCSSEVPREAEPAKTAGTPLSSYSGPLPLLPPPQYPLPRPADVVEAVYEFAGRRPDVLRYVPCFCGCQASGHVGNDDCFVSSRDASGKPTWDLHGMGWAICIDVARDAMQMHTAGKPLAEIRSAIEATYKAKYKFITPTPYPPHGS